MTRRGIALMVVLTVVVIVVAVGAYAFLRSHRSLRVIAAGGEARVVRIESPCSRWQDLFGDCKIPAGAW